LQLPSILFGKKRFRTFATLALRIGMVDRLSFLSSWLAGYENIKLLVAVSSLFPSFFGKCLQHASTN